MTVPFAWRWRIHDRRSMALAHRIDQATSTLIPPTLARAISCCAASKAVPDEGLSRSRLRLEERAQRIWDVLLHVRTTLELQHWILHQARLGEVWTLHGFLAAMENYTLRHRPGDPHYDMIQACFSDPSPALSLARLAVSHAAVWLAWYA